MLVKGMEVAGVRCAALVDSVSSRTLVHASRCRQWHSRKLHVMTVSGQQLERADISDLPVAVPGLRRAACSMHAASSGGCGRD